MKVEFIYFDNLIVMEVCTGETYEYYTRDMDKDSVFVFSFGCDDRFTKEQLGTLIENDYFTAGGEA